MGAKKIYDDLREERGLKIVSEIDKKLKVKTRTLKANESLKTAVLTTLVERKYDECVDLLENYTHSYGKFIDFQRRVSPYISHCINLIRAVEIKRGFPQITAMPIIKQQELMDKVIEDFNELRLYLVRIEAMYTEVIYRDALSMTIVLRTLIVCSVVLCIIAACAHIGSSGIVFLDNFLDEISLAVASWVF